MPINARPEYFKAEEKYNLAKSIPEKIKALEEMLRTAPSHKGSEVLRAGIKQKLAKFRNLLEKEKSQQKGKGYSLTVKKEGAAQVMLVSLPNAGKSSILAAITNAKPEIAEYEFTTTKPEVGIMEYEGIKVQIVEIPALYPDFAYKGQGPALFSIIRNSDLIVIVLDTTNDEESQISTILSEFEKAQIKLNEKRPPIQIKKTGAGGITITGQEYITASKGKIIKILRENGCHNAEIIFRGRANLEELNDALNDSLVYKRAIYARNKKDLSGKGDLSAKTGEGIEKLKRDIWKNLDMIRVFTKSPGKNKDWPPIALKKGATVGDLARYIHKDFIKRFKYAKVWGKSVKFGGATVGLNHLLAEDDVVEIHLK